MNEKIYISYLLTTYNKKDYISVSLPYFLSQLNENEELVIYDGGSSDGSVEIIGNLVKNKPNVIFRSERDIGEADGLNKCLLTAKGKYLKVISDDDVYHFPTIRKACRWMDENEDCDWIGSNGFSVSFKNNHEKLIFKDEESFYYKYKKNYKPFLLTGLSYLIRRKSLSKLGLFNTTYKIVDFEYSLRNLSNRKINFALSLLPFYVNIVNPDSNSSKYYISLIREFTKLQKFYQSEPYLMILLWEIKQKFFCYSELLRRDKIHHSNFNFQKKYLEYVKTLDTYNCEKSFNVLY